MKRFNLINRKNLIFLLILVVPLTGMLSAFGQQKKDTQEPLKYTVNVEAHLVPFFAVDKNGKPVFSLEEKDIEFLVNGKPFPIAGFSRYQFQGEQPGQLHQPQVEKKYPERFVFIVIDYMFNSRKGIQRSKEIAHQIMQKSSPGDTFILLANYPRMGLEYLYGPEKDKEALAQAIKTIWPRKAKKKDGLKELKKDIKKLRRSVVGFRGAGASREEIRKSKIGNPYVTSSNRDLIEYSDNQSRIGMGKKLLMERIKTFKRAIVSLKYALRSITASKIIYLISEGLPINSANSSLEDITDNDFYFSYLEEIAKSVNLGGSILNVVDAAESATMQYAPSYSRYTGSANYVRKVGKESLQHLAKESGGSYFGGPDVDKIVTGIKNYTAAYYEIAFMNNPSMQKMRFEIKCKKPGIQIHSVIEGEKQTPYRKMPKLQKEVFIVNVITGGSWSRMVGKVTKTKYKKIKSKGKKKKHIEVVIPEHMRYRKNDIFIVHMDPVTMKADFEYMKRKLNEKESLKIRMDEESFHFFVIIDPQTSSCIYNRVR